MPSSGTERRIAACLAAALVAMAAASPLLPGNTGAAINGPSFLAAYDFIAIVCDSITGFLLIAQFRQTGSVLLVNLAAGYLFTAMMAASHVVLIPGLLLTINPLGATDNSSLVIRAFWMAGQPCGAVAGLLARWLHPGRAQATGPATAVAISCAVAMAAIALLLATRGIGLMPKLTVEAGAWRATYLYFLPAVLGIQAAAVVSVFVTSRGRTALMLWLMLALLAGMVETMIAWFFVALGLAAERRYSPYFYVARAGGVLSTSVLLLVLLQQIGDLYRRLIATLHSLKTSEQRLVEQQRMEAVGRLAGGVAHDFNNLLMVIIGNLEMVRARVSDERQRRMLGMAMDAAHRGGNLTRQMLTFARRQLLRPMPEDINERLKEMRDMIRSAAGGMITLVEDFQSAGPQCAIDRTEFEWAVLNIVVNAQYAMPSGGRLTMRTRTVELPPPKGPAGSTPGLAPGRYVEVTFHDTGPGMPPEILSQAFEPFFTTKPVGQGSGLGLSQVHGFARQSGGDALLASPPEGGTRVTMLLPLMAATNRSPAAGRSPAPDDLAATIMVVEDAPEVRDAVAQTLTNRGCRVLSAGNAAEGLAMLTRHCAELDILLTDIVMPGKINGIMLADLAQRRYPHLSVLLMTGYAHQPAARNDHVVLRKPFSEAELIETMHAALVGRRAGETGP